MMSWKRTAGLSEERQDVRLLVDLTKGDLASAIAAVENVLARLRG